MAVVGFHIPGFEPMKTTTAELDAAIQHFHLADMTQLKALCIANQVKYPAMDISRTALLVILCNAFTEDNWPRVPAKKQAVKILRDARLAK